MFSNTSVHPPTTEEAITLTLTFIPFPKVRVFDIEATDLTDGDVLVLATDGLWDITSNDRAVSMVAKSLSHFPPDHHDKHKYR